MRWVVGLLLLAGPACGLAWSPAWGQEALYGAQPPAGSAYVRFVNATGAGVVVEPEFLPRLTLGADGADRVGAYAVVEGVSGRRLGVRVGDRREALSVVPDRYATVLVTDAGVTVIEEAGEFNQARARLSFYNAAAGCERAAVALEPAGVAVFSGVGVGEARSRTVRPVEAALRVQCGEWGAEQRGAEERGAGVRLEGVEAGRSYSVWLMEGGGEPVGFVTRDVVVAYRR